MYINTPDLATARLFYLDALVNEAWEKALAAESRGDWRAQAKWESLMEKRSIRLNRFDKQARLLRDAMERPG